MTKALALFSGGLDSVLAAKLIQIQDIEVIGICFASAFFGSKNAEKMAAQIDLPLIVVDFTEEHLKMTKNPKHGYGKNMNPCIDCHAMMLNYAGNMLGELNADFLITGEVLNQRPMSQNKKSLGIVQKESGFEDKILRPLCALNLAPTQMENDGLVDRTKLMGISGKSRKPQIELAEKLGIKEYPSPAGGCMLTEPQFAKRLEDLYKHDMDNAKPIDIKLLRVGRHMRISPDAKLVCTRNEDEYKLLQGLLKKEYIIFDTADCAGSTAVLISAGGKIPSQEDIDFAGSVVARYSKEKEKDSVRVKYKKQNDPEYKYMNVKPAGDEEIREVLL
ncbi:MAG TPA: tRNA 4-thiouridine(8) synthase ThiI [Bacillota bacterium]|nr:tRNA 4-thiouridine(8) synthase ThiI [Bacillota bacterium]HPL53335.1 tRNA 4-thiouridine(8) synthase ThiI [Bacillota bacterium]